MHGLQSVGVGLFVAAMMVSVGLDLRLFELARALRRPGALAASLVANFGLVPLVALVAVRAFALPPEAAAGLLLVAAAPGGPVGAVLTRVAGGNLALATALTALMGVLDTALTPLLAGLLGAAPAEGVPVPALPMMRTILLWQLLPLAGGLALRHLRPDAARRLLPRVDLLVRAVLVALVPAFAWTAGPRVLAVPPRAAPAIALVVAASLVLGGLLAPPRREDRLALALVAGIRGMSLVVLVAAAWYPDAVTLLVALGYSATMFAASSALALFAARRALPPGGAAG